MAPKFALQNVLDVRHRKAELRQIELSTLLVARQETEQRLESLKEFQRDLLEQLKEAQAGEMDLNQVGLLRMNIQQVNSYIESVSMELARLNNQIQEKKSELIEAKRSEERRVGKECRTRWSAE